MHGGFSDLIVVSNGTQNDKATKKEQVYKNFTLGA